MESKRVLLKMPSLGNLRFCTLSQLVYTVSDIGACVHIVSLKVIVGIRGLIEENTRMDKPELDNDSARWTVQTWVC